MKLRNLTLVAGLLGAFFTNAVFALGMGEIKLNSSLNEPLDAEIQLLNIGDLSELEMLVGLGSREDFKAAGVERLFLLTDLRFKVDMSAPGNPVLRVTSRKPIREPYLDFLLELQWPSGRLLREYTLLLDLPVYATERASAKKIKAASASPQPKPQQAPAAASPRPSSQVAPSNTNGGEYRVAPGDTAWGIAKKIKPDNASIMQSLAAVKQSNPHAFINGNINLLKQGAVLRLPSSADISQLSPQQVNEQVDFSPESAIAEKKPSQPQLDATSSTSTPSPAPVDGGGRLKLAVQDDDVEGASSANASGGGESDVSGGSSTRGTEKLENEFAIFQEELDKTQRENAELKARLSNMEEQIATMSRLVEINDDSLRAAQQVASQEQQVTEEKADSVEEAATQQADLETDTEKAQSAEDQTAETPVASDSDKDSSQKGQDATADKDGGFNLQYWIDLLLYPLIGLLVVLLGIVLFFKNRKQDEEPEEELSLQTLVDKETADEDDLEEVLDEEDKQVLEETVSELDERELKNLEELELTEGEDVDPVGEADIYLSLGNYKQAENVLLDAINEEPDDAALRLKLLEVYVSSNELDKFDAQYAQFSGLSDADAIVRADLLRAELVSDPVNDLLEEEADSEESLDTTETEASNLDEELSFDDVVLDSSSETESTEDSTSDSTSTGESSTSDFDLDLDLENIDLDVDSGLSEEASDLGDSSDTDSMDLGSTDLDSTDLDSIDLDTLASDIDAGMESIDLEESVDGSTALDSSLDDLSDTISETIPEPVAETTSEASSQIAEENAADDFEDFDDDLDVLAGEDECSTKLELAQAYLDMGDPESAKEILDEVVSLGDDAQQDQARKLLEGVT
jgi:pilus assembly protein FimV